MVIMVISLYCNKNKICVKYFDQIIGSNIWQHSKSDIDLRITYLLDYRIRSMNYCYWIGYIGSDTSISDQFIALGTWSWSPLPFSKSTLQHHDFSIEFNQGNFFIPQSMHFSFKYFCRSLFIRQSTPLNIQQLIVYYMLKIMHILFQHRNMEYVVHYSQIRWEF